MKRGKGGGGGGGRKIYVYAIKAPNTTQLSPGCVVLDEKKMEKALLLSAEHNKSPLHVLLKDVQENQKKSRVRHSLLTHIMRMLLHSNSFHSFI